MKVITWLNIVFLNDLGQKKDLIEVGEFILKQAIPTLVNELINGDIILPCDSKSLGELFHAHGVNVRYIGKVCKSITKEKSFFLYILLERIMLAKSIKHFIKPLFRETSSLFHADLVAHILNCIFAPNKVLTVLETANVQSLFEQSERVEQVSTEPKVESQEEKEAKKKKKKKKGANSKKPKEANNFVSPLMDFGSIKIEDESANFINLKPKEVWFAIRAICKSRYLYDLPESAAEFEAFKYPLTKIATLRDVCISTGIILETQNYQLLEKTTVKKEEAKDKKEDSNIELEILPFKPYNIVDIQPVVKHLDPGCDDAKVQMDLVINIRN